MSVSYLLEENSIDKQVLDEMIEIVIIKLCLLYTKQYPSGFISEYSDSEKERLSKVKVDTLINDKLFHKDLVDFFCWGYNTINIIGNRPAMLLELYFFNSEFKKYIDYNLYTSKYIYETEDDRPWNLVELSLKLRRKLGIVRDSDAYNNPDSNEYKLLVCRVKYLLWQFLHKQEVSSKFIMQTAINCEMSLEVQMIPQMKVNSNNYPTHTFDVFPMAAATERDKEERELIATEHGCKCEYLPIDKCVIIIESDFIKEMKNPCLFTITQNYEVDFIGRLKKEEDERGWYYFCNLNEALSIKKGVGLIDF